MQWERSLEGLDVKKEAYPLGQLFIFGGSFSFKALKEMLGRCFILDL